MNSNKFKYFTVALFIAFICTFRNALGNTIPTDADIKTALIFNFLKYTTFSQPQSSDTFYVAVYGEDEYLIKKLFNLQNKSVNGKKVNIRKLDRVNSTYKIDLLYIFHENNFEISRIARLIEKSGILLVTDQYEIKQEVMFNFIQEGNMKIKFEINSRNLKEARLEISPKLLLLGGTEIDIRELYKTTEKTLYDERERSEQFEMELNTKKEEINKLNKLLSSLFVQIDTLNSIINTNLFSIRRHKLKIDSLKYEQYTLTYESKVRKRALDSTNRALASRNNEVNKLDTNLSIKQEELESSIRSLKKLKDEIKDKEIILNEQKGRIATQRITLFVFLAFLFVSMIFLIYIYKNYKIKQLKNIELERRNQQINEQNEKIQAQSLELTHTNLELQKLSLVAEKIDNAVIIMDSKGNLEWVNEGFVRMFGYTFDEFKQKSGINFITASSYNDAANIFRTCLEHKKALSYESEMITKSNQKKWMNSTITPVLNDNNEVIKLVAIDTDITKLKDAENKILKKNLKIEENAEKLRIQAQELTKANQELELQKNNVEVALMQLKNAQSQLVVTEKMASLGQLTSGIAHEINNPINYISSSIEGLRNILDDIKLLMNEYDKLISREIKENEAIQKLKKEINYDDLLVGFEELTSNIKMGVDRTKEIVNSLRTFSRIDKDNFSIIDVNSIIDSAIVLIGKQYKNRINIVRDYQDIPTIEGIAGSLSQVFLNLLVNAIQAIKETGNICISTSLTEDNGKEMAKIEFADTGEGMSEEVLAKIFEPFYTTKDVGEGTGLGLSIVYSIIKQHKGKLDVKSVPGKGTSFNIYLPIKRT